jgi:hypothetical protein
MVFRSSRAQKESADELIHDELTPGARERLLGVVADGFTGKELKSALQTAKKREPGAPFSDYSIDVDSSLDIIASADTELVFSYLEYLIYKARSKRSHSSTSPRTGQSMNANHSEIEYILESEGILFDIYTDEDRQIRFRKISSEEFKEVDEDLRGLASKDWDEELEPYRKAMTMYADGDYSYKILEKLNVSIERVLKKICLNQGWTDDEDRSSGHYVEKMKENDFFETNNIMANELNDLLGYLDLNRKKIEGDRKRHEDLGRNYCTLVMHQTSAYLYFLINRYETEY